MYFWPVASTWPWAAVAAPALLGIRCSRSNLEDSRWVNRCEQVLEDLRGNSWSWCMYFTWLWATVAVPTFVWEHFAREITSRLSMGYSLGYYSRLEFVEKRLMVHVIILQGPIWLYLGIHHAPRILLGAKPVYNRVGRTRPCLGLAAALTELEQR